jgi:pimeloyl-ACP methyl ester carboxylesterase
VTGTVTSADGTRVSFETHGAGSALVLVHGWSCDRSYWREQIEPLSRGFQVVAIDLAGHGESGLGRETWTIGAFGDDVAAVVAQLDLERPILVGHSMGGDVIVEAARRLEGRVRGLIWVDVYKRLGTPRTSEQVRTLMAPFRSDFERAPRPFVRGMFPPSADEVLVERVAADMSAAPPAVALGTMEAAATYDREVTGALEDLKLPAVAINPEDPPTDIESLGRYGIKVFLMPGVGHFPMMEDPPRFNEMLTMSIEDLLR